MINLYLVRHGETTWNVAGRYQGRGNSELTELGQNQAKWLQERLKNISLDIAYASPSGRTIKTAKTALKDKKIPINKDERLMEIDLGIWEGRYKSEIEKEYPEQYNFFISDPTKFDSKLIGSESYYEVQNRAVNALNDMLNANDGKDVIVFSHGLTLKVLVAYMLKSPMENLWESGVVPQTSVTHFEIDNGFKPIMIGDTSHYR